MEIGNIKPELPSLDSATFETSTDALLAGAQDAAKSGDPDATAHQFETLFGSLLVREMRRSMPNGLFGSGAGADVYEGWFDQQLGDALASRDALNLAGMVKASLLRAQSAQETAQAEAGAQKGAPGANTEPEIEPKAAEPSARRVTPVHPEPLPLVKPLPVPEAPVQVPLSLAPARSRPLPLAREQHHLRKVPVRPIDAPPIRGAKESGR